MIVLYDTVKIRSNGVIGTVIDIASANGKDIYTVESNEESTPGGYGGRWKMFECLRTDIEKISTH